MRCFGVLYDRIKHIVGLCWAYSTLQEFRDRLSLIVVPHYH